MKSICKIALLENYALFSSGIKSILNDSEELEVVAEGTSPESLFLHLSKVFPDIIVFDMIHCSNAGIATAKQIGKIPVICCECFLRSMI